MEYGIFGLIVLIADIYAIIQIIGSRASGLSKLIWALVVFFLPVLGFVSWLVAGPRSSTATV